MLEALDLNLHRKRFGLGLIFHQGVSPRLPFCRQLCGLRQPLRRVGKKHPGVEVVGVDRGKCGGRLDHLGELILAVIRTGEIVQRIARVGVFLGCRFKELDCVVSLVDARGDHASHRQREVVVLGGLGQHVCVRRGAVTLARQLHGIGPRAHDVAGFESIRRRREDRLQIRRSFLRHRLLLVPFQTLRRLELAHCEIIQAAALELAVGGVRARCGDHSLPVTHCRRGLLFCIGDVGQDIVRIRAFAAQRQRANRIVAR